MNVNAVGNSKQPLQQAKLEAQPAQPAQPAQSAQAGGANGIAAQQPASAAPPKAASSSEPQELKGSVDAINSFIKTFSNNLEFSIDEESGRTVVKLVDTETDTVLRQYPTKEALALARDIENFQGHLLKTEA